MNLVINIPKDKFNLLEINYKDYISKGNANTVFIAKKNNLTISLYKTGKLVLQGLKESDIEKEKEKIIGQVFDSREEFILGFDETGRSEITGPFVITGMLGENKDLAIVRDSKKTDNIEKAKARVDSGALGYVTFTLNPKLIDYLRTKGVTLNTMEETYIFKIKELFEDLNLDFKTIVDGNPLSSKKIGAKYIPKADDLIPVVSAASIISKSFRDYSKNKDKRKTWNTKNI